MTLSAIIFALQMMFGANNVTPAQVNQSVCQTQQSGIIVVTDQQEGI
jgi:hypothetical protein